MNGCSAAAMACQAAAWADLAAQDGRPSDVGVQSSRWLIEHLLRRMAEQGADFTLTFRALADAAEGNAAPARTQFTDPAAFDSWAEGWRSR